MTKTVPGEGLVGLAVSTLRQMILSQPTGTQIGSLPDIARALGVGVVTVQQAARVLEHEGFLSVRRGNRGGYYGTRPDPAALGRAIAGFLQGHQSREREAIEIMTLLDCDLVAAAARAIDEPLRERLRLLSQRIDGCDTADMRGSFETEMHDILYRMVDKPLMEMLARVTMQHLVDGTGHPIFRGAEGIARWKRERHGIITAILARDPRLARFEAERRREDILHRLDAGEIDTSF